MVDVVCVVRLETNCGSISENIFRPVGRVAVELSPTVEILSRYGWTLILLTVVLIGTGWDPGNNSVDFALVSPHGGCN